jgi:hypothetical protein
MGALASIIGAISDEVVANLAAASYPPLVDGAIVVGTAAEFELTTPPRIIFDPSPGSKFSAPEYYSASQSRSSEERLRENAMRTIAAENVSFFVHCWGAANTGVPVDDYDVTRMLAHAVRAALHNVMPGAYEVEESGKYRTGSNLVRLGRWYTFGLTIYTPVLSSLLPYDRVRQYAPDGTVASGGIVFDSATGEAEHP